MRTKFSGISDRADIYELSVPREQRAGHMIVYFRHQDGFLVEPPVTVSGGVVETRIGVEPVFYGQEHEVMRQNKEALSRALEERLHELSQLNARLRGDNEALKAAVKMLELRLETGLTKSNRDAIDFKRELFVLVTLQEGMLPAHVIVENMTDKSGAYSTIARLIEANLITIDDSTGELTLTAAGERLSNPDMD